MATAYLWNTNNIYIGTEEAQPDPLSEGGFIPPKNGTLLAPPQEAGKQAHWTGTEWELIDPPAPDSEEIADRGARRILAETDAVHGARGTEDLVATLIAKGLITEADLSPEYLDRKALRDAVRRDIIHGEG